MHEPAPVPAPIPRRADAVRNREAILVAARAVFRRDGLAAQMDAIAEAAGLGVGTLYRHFPTREALIAVLIEEHQQRLLASAAAAARLADPWAAVADLVWQLATFEAEDRGIADILADEYTRAGRAAASMTTFMEYLAAVMVRAQAAGAMRQDVSAEDVVFAVCGVGKMMRPDDDPGRWQRLVGVFLDGLRAPAAG